MMFGAGTRGAQDHLLDQVIIYNANDLSNVKHACYFDHNLGIHEMDASYDGMKLELKISVKSGETLKFSDFQAIHYAADSDLNLCDKNSYLY